MGKNSILLVDDDPVMLATMEIFLEDFYAVTTVTSGKLALDFLSRHTVDLILLDYMMPEMNGPEVFQNIRSCFPQLPVPIIFLTGVSDKELVIKGISLRPKDYLLKPVSKKDLLERVTRVLAKS